MNFNRKRRYKIYSILKIIYAKLEFFKKSIEVFVSRKSRRGESRWKFSRVRSCENTGATVVTHNSVIRVTCYRQIALQSLVTFYKYARWLLTLRCVWRQVIETKTCIHFLSIRGANEVGGKPALYCSIVTLMTYLKICCFSVINITKIWIILLLLFETIY